MSAVGEVEVAPESIPVSLVEAVASEPFVRRVVVGFDGVLHSYSSGWQGPTEIGDPPVPDAIAWLNLLAGEGFEVVVQTPRARFEGAAAAIERWLRENGYEGPVPLIVPRFQATVILDRVAFRFRGRFPGPSEIRHKMRPWRSGEPTAAEVGRKMRERNERHRDYVARLEASNGRLKGERASLRVQLLRETLYAAGYLDEAVAEEWLRQNAERPFGEALEAARALRRAELPGTP